MRRALFLVAALLVAGCTAPDDARGGLVPYPRVGDVAVYEASGALLEFARWENGIPFAAARAQVRLTVGPGPDVLDGARAIHASYHVRTEVAEAGVFAKRSERFVSERHGEVVQSFHPLSQDQSIVAFDERGFPWLFGASTLFGEELADGAEISFLLPDNLGIGNGPLVLAWRVVGVEDGFVRLDLEGSPMLGGSLWMAPGAAWPARVALEILGPLDGMIRSDGGYPVRMNATRTSLSAGGEPLPARDRAATFGDDASAERIAWDGEKPPDGDAATFAYPLSEAVRDAKLLDRPLADWLAAHDTPIIYRATYQREAGPIDGSQQGHWLLQWVDRADAYYEVQIARIILPAPLPGGVPVVEKSAPAQQPSDRNHGWFASSELPEKLVPLSEGVRIVREVFGAQEVQIFLRSFADPPGYSYFIDGGFEGPGRYTVVYHPSTGFIEQATGPVAPRLAS